MNTSSRHCRFWRPRFSMRWLLLAVVLVSGGFAWLHYRIREGRRHEAIARQLVELGCTVEFSHFESVPDPASTYSFMGVPIVPNRRASTLPAWMDKLSLDNTVRRIDTVHLNPRPRADAERAADLLTKLDDLRHVGRHTIKFRLEHLTRLTATTRVESLYLKGMMLPRGRIPALAHPALKSLSVERSQFSNPAIADLPASMEHLNVARTHIDDEGLAQFTRLRRLKTLNLSLTPTSPEAIEDLRRQMPWCKITWEPLLNP